MSNINLGRQIEDDYLLLASREQLAQAIAVEGDDPSFWCVMILTSGRSIIRRHGRLNLSEPHKVLAMTLAHRLNAEAAFDGAWFCAWANPSPDTMIPVNLFCVWKDQDGDAPFHIAFDDRIDALIACDMNHLLTQCEMAYRQYWADLANLDIKPQHMRKLAQGQRFCDAHPTSGKVDPIILPAAAGQRALLRMAKR
ncbi:MAG: hypothetical protein IPK75_19000 [Acidobacteria bacterium]|nr:hypothetical protein [Acidobacteriota bacterium]